MAECQLDLRLDYNDPGIADRHMGLNVQAAQNAIDWINSSNPLANNISVPRAVNRVLRQHYVEGMPSRERALHTIMGKTDLAAALFQHKKDPTKYPEIFDEIAQQVTLFRNQTNGKFLKDLVASVGTPMEAIMEVSGGRMGADEKQAVSAFAGVGNLSKMFGVLTGNQYDVDHVLALMGWDKKKINKYSDAEFKESVKNLLVRAFDNQLNSIGNLLPLLSHWNVDKSNKITSNKQIAEYIARAGNQGMDLTYYMHGAIMNAPNAQQEYNIFMHKLSRDKEGLNRLFNYFYVPTNLRQRVLGEIKRWEGVRSKERIKLEKEYRARVKQWEESQIKMNFRNQ